ncbi:NrdH-redoxin [Bacillus thuringiensis]|nr:NrdH-redoxin [Bacillus thuringiensis]
MKMEIIMYTGDNCPKCNRAKVMLESCPVDFDLVERNVDKDAKYKQELTETLNSHTLPTFDIYDGTTRIDILRGFDENQGKLRNILGL